MARRKLSYSASLFFVLRKVVRYFVSVVGLHDGRDQGAVRRERSDFLLPVVVLVSAAFCLFFPR